MIHAPQVNTAPYQVVQPLGPNAPCVVKTMPSWNGSTAAQKTLNQPSHRGKVRGPRSCRMRTPTSAIAAQSCGQISIEPIHATSLSVWVMPEFTSPAR